MAGKDSGGFGALDLHAASARPARARRPAQPPPLRSGRAVRSRARANPSEMDMIGRRVAAPLAARGAAARLGAMQPYLALMPQILDQGVEQMDRTGTGHAVAVRGADALRPRRRLSLADDQEAPPAIDHRRIAVVPARRHQCPLAAGAQGQHLERMGRRSGRPRPGLWQAVARLGGARRPPHRPDRRADRADQARPRLAPPDRQRVEPGRAGGDGAGAVPLPVPDAGRGAGGSTCSCTSAAPTSSSACRSISPATRC